MQAVALHYKCFIVKKVKAVKEISGKKDGQKAAKRMELEKKLLLDKASSHATLCSRTRPIEAQGGTGDA